MLFLFKRNIVDESEQQLIIQAQLQIEKIEEMLARWAKRTSICSRKTKNVKKWFDQQLRLTTKEIVTKKRGDTAFLDFEIIIIVIFFSPF